MLDIGPAAEALWLRGLCYAGEHQTDGRVPGGFVRRMGDMDGPAESARLVAAGLWETDGEGWTIRGYLDWQSSKEQIDHVTAQRVEAGRRGGRQKAANAARSEPSPSKTLASAKDLLEHVSSKRLPEVEIEIEVEGSPPPAPPSGGRDGPAKPDGPKRNGALARIPDGWEPSAEQRRRAEERFSPAFVADQTERFRDHFHGSGARKLDWEAAWRNWLRNEADGKYGRRAPPAPSRAEREMAMLLEGTE